MNRTEYRAIRTILRGNGIAGIRFCAKQFQPHAKKLWHLWNTKDRLAVATECRPYGEPRGVRVANLKFDILERLALNYSESATTFAMSRIPYKFN